LQVVSLGKQHSQEVSYSTACGKRVFYALKSPLRDNGGVVVGTCAVAVDITERKEAEASLSQEIARRDEFLAMLSHELRNPMGAVLNAVEVLQDAKACASLAGDPCQVVKRQTRHMARLLDDLLDVARIGRNKIEFRKEVVDLSALAHDIVEAVQYEAAAKRQVMDTSICEGPLPVFADPARIKQAQVNLLVNATKYTPEAGNIWYEIGREGDEAVIVVRDSGVGIPAELLDSLFDLFVQSECTLARSSGGLGVGLSLARSIVVAHGGSIVAESDGRGKGSTFRVRLPLTEQSIKPKLPAPHFAFRGRKLLLVEDNHDARTMLTKTLQLQGFKVAAAGDGRTALELFRSLQPDVAVIDIGLPLMDGYQLAREIRKTNTTSRSMLIALTGYGRKADRQAAIDAGFDAHLVKPLNPTDLYELISASQSAQSSG
jgi:two-component system CheB/CheR fusion protein